MKSLIPSKQVREYLDQIGFHFTDFEKAAMIWNSFDPLSKRLELLEELMRESNDHRLNMQIKERLEYEDIVKKTFAENKDSEHVYVVSNHNCYPRGFFANYSTAEKYVQRRSEKYKEPHYIEKQLIVKGDSIPDVKSSIYFNYNLSNDFAIDETEEYDGSAIACISLDKDMNVTNTWSDEVSLDQQIDEFDKTRFENAFIKIPYPDSFEKGRYVRNVITGKEGVIITSKKEWKEFCDRVAEGLYADFSDMTIKVMICEAAGYWIYDHINPIYLELATPDEYM